MNHDSNVTKMKVDNMLINAAPLISNPSGLAWLSVTWGYNLHSILPAAIQASYPTFRVNIS